MGCAYFVVFFHYDMRTSCILHYILLIKCASFNKIGALFTKLYMFPTCNSALPFFGISIKIDIDIEIKIHHLLHFVFFENNYIALFVLKCVFIMPSLRGLEPAVVAKIKVDG